MPRSSISLFASEPVSSLTKYPGTFNFFRMWNAIVGPANLPQEAEIDRLRDALPVNVVDMLVGVTQVTKAWDILNKRFGDKELIATKLKVELKNISISESLDYEKVIAVAIKVRSLVSRLEAVKASDALKYDGEFLSAVFFQLPERQKCRWLEFKKDGYEDKWSGMLAFLDVSFEFQEEIVFQ